MEEFLDEKIIALRLQEKKKKYSTAATGVYVNGEIIQFAENRLFEDKLRIMLPENFVDLPEELARWKYPAEHRPQIIKSSPDTAANFTFSHYALPLGAGQAKKMADSFRTVAQNMNPANVFFDFAEEDLDGLLTAWFDYKSYGADEQIYNLMYVLPLDGKLLHGTFNCTFIEYADWKPAALAALRSISDLTVTKQREIK